MPVSDMKIYKPNYKVPGKETNVGASINNFDPRAPEHRVILKGDIVKLRDRLLECNPKCPFIVNLEVDRFPSGNKQPLLQSPEFVHKPTITQEISKAQQHLFDTANEKVVSDAKLSDNSYQLKFAQYATNQPHTSAKDIESATRGQHNNPLWHKHRVGRITASKFGAISSRRQTTAPDNLIKDIMAYKSTTQARQHIPALEHGRKTEQKAKTVYADYMKGMGTPVVIQECRLFVDEDNPWCGASPDGLVVDNSYPDPEGLLEIKCPYDKEPVTINKLIDTRKRFYLVRQGGTRKIHYIYLFHENMVIK